MNESPASILYDGYGNPVGVINGALSIVTNSTEGIINTISTNTLDTLLVSPNQNRKRIFIYNDTTSATLKIGLTSFPVSVNYFTVELIAGGFFEIPLGYTGEIRGIWSVNEADGYARITELY